MTTEQHINRLEKDINHVTETISEVKDQLDILVTLVNEMNKGLYGDSKNDHVGVIAKQMAMNHEIAEIKQKILLIEQKNIDQDLMLKTSKLVKGDFYEWGSKIIGWIVQGIIIYAIVRGVVDPDAMLKIR